MRVTIADLQLSLTLLMTAPTARQSKSTKTNCPRGDQTSDCTTCIEAKHRVWPFPQESETEYSEIGDLTYTDVWGPEHTQGRHGERYFTFTDASRKYKTVAFLKHKSEADQEIKRYREFISTQFGKKCKAFRFEGGGKYVSKAFRNQLKEEGIRVEMTAPHSPSQNGVSEWLNLTIAIKARAMMRAQNIPGFFWPEAVTYAVYLINRSPTRSLKTDITPYEVQWCKKPDVSTVQEFGSACWVLAQGAKKPSKLSPRSNQYKFIGLSEETRAWCYWVPGTRKVLTSRNVVFSQLPEHESDSIPIEMGPSRLEGETGTLNKPETPKTGEIDDAEPDQSANQSSDQTQTEPKRRNKITVPPRDPLPHRGSTNFAPGHFSSMMCIRPLNNPANNSPQRPEAWRHRVQVTIDPDIAAVAINEDHEPRNFREVLEHPQKIYGSTQCRKSGTNSQKWERLQRQTYQLGRRP